MKKVLQAVIPLVIVMMFANLALAQLGTYSKEKRIEFTSQWEGERFPDGRPKVSDEALKKLENTTPEESLGLLMGGGYRFQFSKGWQVINPSEKRLIGRVVTAVFMPLRPEIEKVINEYGKKEGRVERGQNSWVIDTLVPGDVLVVDLFGKIEDGTFIGDNLGTSICSKTGKGLIVDGSVRDVSGIQEIEGFQVYTRGSDPSAIGGVTLMGINVPIRIGNVTVMPGDVVVSDPEGLTFIPPQLADRVGSFSQTIQARDRWEINCCGRASTRLARLTAAGLRK